MMAHKVSEFHVVHSYPLLVTCVEVFFLGLISKNTDCPRNMQLKTMNNDYVAAGM